MRSLLKGCLVLAVLLSIAITPRQSSLAATCPTDSLTKGSYARTLTSGGLERSYLLYVPKGYQADQAMPLVISVHGFTSNAEQQSAFTRWHVLAEKENFLVVYPNGTGIPSRWNAGQSRFIGASTVDDVQFFRDLIAEVSANVCVDPARIFVNGLSNGGGMSNRLACQASDLVAAIGGVAGAYSPVDCEITRAVPVIAFHGTTDPVVDFDGTAAQGFPSIKEWAKEWAVRDGCDLTAEAIGGKGDVSGIRYGGCKDDAEVILYIIDGGGHTWPGSFPIPILGKTTQNINATEVMWEFYKRHPMPE
ncbi:MAG: PHB depolymerase family esterase [Anaerolineae bacterium]